MAMNPDSRAVETERRKVLHDLERWLETPMLILAFVWLGLVIVEAMWGAGPVLEGIGTLIWIIFILDALVRLILAPHKIAYFKENWLTVIGLALPALRIFRMARVVRALRMARAARGLKLVRVVSSLNRGMRALGAGMKRRGFAYVMILTLLVTLTGAAGMYIFERDYDSMGQEPVSAGSGPSRLNDYGAALWWTAMIMTTMGSDYWPRTPEGRILCLLLALYAFAVFGYVTATLASYFIGRDAEDERAEVAGVKSIERLQREIEGLRVELRAVAQKINRSTDGGG
ncbi:MAG: potassium channel family protein [Nitrospiraceae bacterium]|nr:potassium channel family protein [Nitrospiraceae bacterium]